MSKNIKSTGRKFGNFIADKIDFGDLIGGLSGKIAEAADNPVFAFTFGAAYEKVPEEYDERLEKITNLIMSGDKGGLEVSVVDELVEILHTPLGDKRERIVLSHLLGIAQELIELDMDDGGEAEEDSTGGGGPGGDPGGDPPGGG